MRRTQVLISLPALRHNLQRVRETVPQSRILAAVKANGYGHGLERVARTLDAADGFGVARLSEAVALRKAGETRPIVLLEGVFDAEELGTAIHYGFELVLHQAYQIALLEQAKLSSPLAVWLKLDTGMHRLGFPPEQAREQFQRLTIPGQGIEFRGFMTHLANADDRRDPTTTEQLKRFNLATEGMAGAHSVANSAGILGWPDSHSDWVRPGIMLYGVSPFLGGTGADENLRPVMTLKSQIIAINQLQKGDAVGYGGTWRCSEEMPVGVVAIGYGDGYPRHAPSGTPVLVNDTRVQLVGRVSMDMITVDLRGCPDVAVGDEVTLWGEGLAVEEIAAASGTIAYELLCGVTQRVQSLELTE